MFSDCLALAFMALVFIFALACIKCWKEEIVILQQQKRQRGRQEREKE